MEERVAGLRMAARRAVRGSSAEDGGMQRVTDIFACGNRRVIVKRGGAGYKEAEESYELECFVLLLDAIESHYLYFDAPTPLHPILSMLSPSASYPFYAYPRDITKYMKRFIRTRVSRSFPTTEEIDGV